MRVKNGWIMLAIMALWTALPGLSCLAPAAHQDCCRQMMQDCGSSMAMADPSCCKVHSSDPSMPPAQASRPEGTSLSAHIFLSLKFDLVSLDETKTTPVAETPPRASASSHISILRI
ncbi:hypothetical protein P8935_23110 [Telmatobacter sp. DSM 110680]|uniref:Uncharacterized protein n=1 Tax=Telmatobacter sp. DSM 110680 TaxID=3036704 RepID=A0AAU7DJD5_9BACT